MSGAAICFTATILRKRPDLPRYIVLKSRYLPGRTTAFAATVNLNGTTPFARNIRPWRKGSDAFFFNLTEPQCRKAGLDTGDTCAVRVVPVS